MAIQPQQRQGQGFRGGYDDRQSAPIDTSEILFKDISADLFDRIAKNTAICIAANTKSNKPTQLRRFYDEIVMWEQKVTANAKDPQKFTEYLPFIRMINAKVAYAEGRKSSGHGLVDKNYVILINESLKQVDSPETIRIFKLFMEAFMGFYKQERPKD
ncbi:MAG: type III-A CRISPR-associated protein Csm2 [Methylococcales bacterium]